MSKFRPGDIVRVLESPYMTMKKGDFVVCIFGTHAGKSGATDTVRLLVA
jgi:hypothetical protein